MMMLPVACLAVRFESRKAESCDMGGTGRRKATLTRRMVRGRGRVLWTRSALWEDTERDGGWSSGLVLRPESSASSHPTCKMSQTNTPARPRLCTNPPNTHYNHTARCLSHPRRPRGQTTIGCLRMHQKKGRTKPKAQHHVCRPCLYRPTSMTPQPHQKQSQKALGHY